MYNYKYEVKLNYEYCDGSTFPRNTIYEYDDYSFLDEDYKVRIIFKKNFELEISEIITENDEDSFSIACKCADKVCRVVTVLLQLKNCDNRENSPNLTYMPSNIKLLGKDRVDLDQYRREGNVVYLNEHFGLSDGIAMLKITTKLDLSNFDKLYRSFGNAHSINIGEIIYRAALSKNIESRFFQLFTIIEALETKYNEDTEIGNKILQDNQIEKLEEKFSEGINKLSLNQEYAQRLRSRLMQIVKSATIETRAEKLAAIIAKKYDISLVQKGLIKYEINVKKMQEFISARNKLFHGVHSNESERNKLIQLTNELQELCLLLLNSEI